MESFSVFDVIRGINTGEPIFSPIKITASILNVFYNVCCFFFWKGVYNDHTDYNEYILKKKKI